MRTIILLAALLTSGLMSSSSMAARDYYKWTDADGVTHYSARRPHNQEAETISVTTGRRVEGPAAGTSEGDRESDSGSQGTETADRGEEQSENLKDPERCENARSNLQVLRDNARVRMKNEDGEIYYLSDDEKAEKAKQFEQAMAESC